MKKIILPLLFLCYSLRGFVSLDQAEQYAKSMAEFPMNDSGDPEHPDFTTFYTSLKPSWITKTLRSFKLRSEPLWQPKKFLALLEKVTKERSKSGLAEEVPLEPESKILVIDSLHGSFHSLIRILLNWRASGFLDNSFKISDPHTSIVCMGNMTDYSAYSLETLMILLTLLDKNEGHCFYLRGEHEYKRVWYSHSLYEEIKQRLPISAKKAALLLDAFFTSLPKVVTFIKKGAEQLVFSTELEPLQDKQVGIKSSVHPEKHTPVSGLKLHDRTEKGGTIWSVRSAPIGLYRLYNDYYSDSYALISLGKTLSSSQITLYSSDTKGYFSRGPTYNLLDGGLIDPGMAPRLARAPVSLSLDEGGIARHLEFLKAQVDSLEGMVETLEEHLSLKPSVQSMIVQSMVEQPVSPATLEGLNNEMRKIEQDYNNVALDVGKLIPLAIEKGIKAQKALLGDARLVEDDVIILGSTLDLSRSARGLGLSARAGMALRVNKQNREGGIHEKLMQIIFLDDKYIPSLSRRNIEELLAVYHTPFILSPVGTPTLLASYDLIKEKKIQVLFPYSGSSMFRKPDLVNVINLRASFEDEGRALTDHVLKTTFLKKFAFFYQDDDFGKEALAGARDALKKGGIKPVVEVGYRFAGGSFQEIAKKIRRANPEAIGFLSTGPAAMQLIRELGVEFLFNRTLYAVSSVGDDGTKRAIKKKGLPLLLSQVVPNPEASMLEIVKEYRSEAQKYGQNRNVFALEGYIATSIVIDALGKIKETITMDTLRSEMEKIKEYTFKGLHLNFNPKDRSLARYVWIDSGNEEWIRKDMSKE